MSSKTTRLRALTGAALAAGVTAASLAAVPASAATATVPDLKWNVSEQFVRHLFLSHTFGTLPTAATGTVSGGATWVQGDPAVSTDDYFTFDGGTSTTEEGVTTRTYTGTVRGAFVSGGTEFYSVTITDPSVIVEADGTGEIVATVSSASAERPPATPAESVEPTRVTIAELDASQTLGESVYATPAWEGVIAPDSPEATAAGIPAGKPTDGKSFHPDLYTALVAGVKPHFYASGSGSDALKAPGAVAPVPAVTPTVLSSSYADGVKVKVDGVGFNPATNDGDNGVYVGIGPSDAVIDFGNRAGGTAALAKVDWIDPTRFTGDRFTTVLQVDTAKLDPAKSYSIYTWQAHVHSNTTQDTKTPVAIDWSKLQAPVVVPPVTTPTTPDASAKAKVKVRAKLTKPSRKTKGKLVLTLTSTSSTKPTGKVKVALKRGNKKVKVLSAKITKRGRAVVKLPKARAGAYKLIVTYAGDATHTKAKKALKFRVR